MAHAAAGCASSLLRRRWRQKRMGTAGMRFGVAGARRRYQARAGRGFLGGALSHAPGGEDAVAVVFGGFSGRAGGEDGVEVGGEEDDGLSQVWMWSEGQLGERVAGGVEVRDYSPEAEGLEAARGNHGGARLLGEGRRGDAEESQAASGAAVPAGADAASGRRDAHAGLAARRAMRSWAESSHDSWLFAGVLRELRIIGIVDGDEEEAGGWGGWSRRPERGLRAAASQRRDGVGMRRRCAPHLDRRCRPGYGPCGGGIRWR